jgi:hypothetical protein
MGRRTQEKKGDVKKDEREVVLWFHRKGGRLKRV